MKFKDFLENKINEAGFKGLPKGWTEESLKKWMSTFKKNHGKGPKDDGFFDVCVDAMSDDLGGEENAKKFCAAVKDEAWDSTYWRGKGKTKKEVKKDVKKHKNV
jgi:hypothetical protein